MTAPEIRIEGLAELNAALKAAEQLEDRKELRVGLKAAAGIVATEAKSRVPSQSGRAAGAIRASATVGKAFVVEGKASVPYVGWLDFGSRTPRTGNDRATGPWAGSGKGPDRGRFIYPAVDAKETEVVAAVGIATDHALDALDL